MKLTRRDIGYDPWDACMTPPDTEPETWLVDLSTDLAAEIPGPRFCTDMDAYRALEKHFHGDTDRFDDETVATLTDMTNENLIWDYGRDEAQESAA